MKKIMGLVLLLSVVILTGCQNPKETCDEGYIEVGGTCEKEYVLRTIQSDEEYLKVVDDAQSLVDAAKIFCLDSACDSVIEFTYSDLKVFVSDIEVSWYQFDLYEEADEARVVVVLNEDGKYEVFLRAKESGYMEWVNLAPEYFAKSERVSQLTFSMGTPLENRE